MAFVKTVFHNKTCFIFEQKLLNFGCCKNAKIHVSELGIHKIIFLLAFSSMTKHICKRKKIDFGGS